MAWKNAYQWVGCSIRPAKTFRTLKQADGKYFPCYEKLVLVNFRFETVYIVISANNEITVLENGEEKKVNISLVRTNDKRKLIGLNDPYATLPYECKDFEDFRNIIMERAIQETKDYLQTLA